MVSLYQSGGYCKKRVRVRIDAKELWAEVRPRPRVRTLRGNVNLFIRRCNLHRTLSVAAPRTLYLASLSRDKIHICFHMFTCILHRARYSYPFTLYHIYSSYHARSGESGSCSFAPFISLRLLLLPTSIHYVLAFSSFNSRGNATRIHE